MANNSRMTALHVGRAKARRLMHKAGVAVQRPRRRGAVRTDSRHHYAVAPNLLARQFDVTAPDHVWAGDITYIWTAEGWLYLAVLVDLYSRKVVGLGNGPSYGDNLGAGCLADGARSMALLLRDDA